MNTSYDEPTRRLKRRQNEDVEENPETTNNTKKPAAITSSSSSQFLFTSQSQYESSSSSSSSSCFNSWGIIRHALLSPSNNGSDASSADVPTAHHDNDLLLAEEMNRLTFEERERVYDDINGVGKAHEESPVFIEKCINELDEILGRRGMKLRNYNRAIFLRPSLQGDRKFKLMFLRADQYDAQKAADRMMKYFDLKLELFGDSKLTKRITIDDLSEEELMYIRSGFVVNLPFKDQSGRPVILCDYSCLDPSILLTRKQIESANRCFWYMIMVTVAECEMAQKLGICTISYCSGFDKWDSTAIKALLNSLPFTGFVIQSLPCRLTSYRVCYDNPRLQFIINSMKFALGGFTSLRVRTHLGSDLEHDYFLMSVGIPYKGLFQKIQQQHHQRRSKGSTNVGNDEAGADIGFHESYIQRRQKIDSIYQKEKFEKEQKLGIVEHPSLNDVLIGRGGSYQSHTGNQFWNRLLLANIEEYRNSTNNFDKTCISMDMVKVIVKDRKGRFLQRANKTSKEGGGPGWTILSETLARKKAASAFRTRLSRLGNSKNDDNNSGSIGDNIGLAGGANTARDAKRLRHK